MSIHHPVSIFLKDYIKEHKEEKLSEENITEVDFALFALFCLFDMENCFPGKEESATFSEVLSVFETKHSDKKLGLLLPGDIAEAMFLAKDTLRYSSLRIHDSYYLHDKEEITQSSVFQIDISDRTTCLVFGSTDDTLAGWEENLRMAFIHEVPCLVHCLDYVNTRLDQSRYYYFVGHSKGGMEAMYTGIKTELDDDHILGIYGFDNPGFDEERQTELLSSPRLSKIRFFCPQESVVGRIMRPIVTPAVIRSKAFGVIQHDLATWYIHNDHFQTVKEFNKGSDFLPNRINEIVRDTRKDKALEFIFSVFALFRAGNSETLTQCSKRIPLISKALHDTPKAVRDSIFRFLAFMINGNLLPFGVFDDLLNDESLSKRKENSMKQQVLKKKRIHSNLDHQ